MPYEYEKPADRRYKRYVEEKQAKEQARKEDKSRAQRNTQINQRKAQDILAKIDLVQTRLKDEARPIEVVRDVGNFIGGILSIVRPNSVVDDFPRYGRDYSRVVGVTRGWILTGAVYHPETSSSGWGETTVTPASNRDALLTVRGNIYKHVFSPIDSNGYIAEATSVTNTHEVVGLRQQQNPHSSGVVSSSGLINALDNLLLQTDYRN